MKKCVKCDIDITNRGPRFKYCQECSDISKKESTIKYLSKEENKKMKNEYNKNYYDSNKEKLKPVRKKWRADNKEKEIEYNKERYYNVDKERLSKYYADNKEEINTKRFEYRKTDEYKKWIKEYKIKNAYKNRYRDSLKSVIRRLNRNKNDYTSILLGYSDIEFKNHIENQFTENMSWENRESFDIDHIIPISAFIKDVPLYIVCALENLKPMKPDENNKKYTSIDYDYIHLYKKYLEFLNDDYKNIILDYISS
jgi:hypothetical protein